MTYVRPRTDIPRSNTSIVTKLPVRQTMAPDPELLMWRRLIDTAVADAMKTQYGVPTYGAILARWWIEEHRPLQTDKRGWMASFGCACHWLGLDVDDECKRLSALIRTRLRKAAMEFARGAAYVRRAEVLACLGRPTAIARQLVLGLVSAEEYKVIAGINTPEKQPRLFDRADRKRKRAA